MVAARHGCAGGSSGAGATAPLSLRWAAFEIPELIRVAAPVYVKFGLRNAPDVYPSGTHLEPTAVALSRERVRRGRLGLELLERSGYEASRSELGAAGLAVPTPQGLAVQDRAG